MALQVVFGAGQVGAELARTLAARGERVRVVRRTDRPVGAGVEVVAADARDPDVVLRLTEGASTIFHCMNPSAYTAAAWERELPAMGEALIGAAVRHGSRLVVLDNLYAYGPTDAARTEDSPMAPTGPKGRVRAAWDERLRRAAREQGLRFVVGRAGDFFGPGTEANSLLSAQNLRGLREGRRVLLVGAPGAEHALSYLPDVVAGLAQLGAAGADVEGSVFHLPIVQVAPGRLVQDLGAAWGVRARLIVLPAWAVRALAPVVSLFRELRETLYQWDRPFLASDARFRARFPGVASGYDDVVAGLAATLR